MSGQREFLVVLSPFFSDGFFVPDFLPAVFFTAVFFAETFFAAVFFAAGFFADVLDVFLAVGVFSACILFFI